MNKGQMDNKFYGWRQHLRPPFCLSHLCYFLLSIVTFILFFPLFLDNITLCINLPNVALSNMSQLVYYIYIILIGLHPTCWSFHFCIMCYNFCKSCPLNYFNADPMRIIWELLTQGVCILTINKISVIWALKIIRELVADTIHGIGNHLALT